MKKNTIFPLLFALLMSFSFMACNDNRKDDTMDDQTEVGDNTGTTGNGATGNAGNTGTGMQDGTQVTFWDTNREYTYQQREEYKTQLASSVQRLNERIENLEERADDATGEEKQALEQRIDELKKSRSNIQEKMNGFANVAEDKWDSFVSDMNSAWGDVQDSYDEIVRDIDAEIQKDGKQY